MENQDCSINVMGDICTGDTIVFTESIFAGSFRNPRKIGERKVCANIISESYGKLKQQHTFTLLIIESSGVQPLKVGKTYLRKGRNIHRGDPHRAIWADEALRVRVLAEKHSRGRVASLSRNARKSGKENDFILFSRK